MDALNTVYTRSPCATSTPASTHWCDRTSAAREFRAKNSRVTSSPHKTPAPRPLFSTPTKLGSGCGSDHVKSRIQRSFPQLASSLHTSGPRAISRMSFTPTLAASAGRPACSTSVFSFTRHAYGNHANAWWNV